VRGSIHQPQPEPSQALSPGNTPCPQGVTAHSHLGCCVGVIGHVVIREALDAQVQAPAAKGSGVWGVAAPVCRVGALFRRGPSARRRAAPDHHHNHRNSLTKLQQQTPTKLQHPVTCRLQSSAASCAAPAACACRCGHTAPCAAPEHEHVCVRWAGRRVGGTGGGIAGSTACATACGGLPGTTSTVASESAPSACSPGWCVLPPGRRQPARNRQQADSSSPALICWPGAVCVCLAHNETRAVRAPFIQTLTLPKRRRSKHVSATTPAGLSAAAPKVVCTYLVCVFMTEAGRAQQQGGHNLL
jgi:hypothetical protein